MRFVVIFLIALAAPVWAQVAATANAGYRTAEGRAGVVKLLSDPHRDSRQRPKELMETLKLKPGSTVADLGTGVGYLLPWLSRAVGPNGKVIAQDIFPDFLDRAKETARNKKLANTSFVLGNEKDARLPQHCCDIVLALDSYHHFDYPAEMLSSIARALRLGGRFVIVDFYKRPEAMPNGRAMEHIRLDVDDVVKEVQSHGWRLVSRSEHNPKSQYIAIFEKQ